MSRKLQREERNSKELFEALELLTLGNKQNKKEILSSKRKIKKFKKEIASFLSHKEECIIFSLEVLGRKKQNAKRCAKSVSYNINFLLPPLTSQACTIIN